MDDPHLRRRQISKKQRSSTGAFFLLMTILGFVLGLAAPATAQPPADVLTFVEAGTVEVTVGEDDPKLLVALRNASTEDIDGLAFHALINRKEISLEATGSALGRGEVRQFELTFPKDDVAGGDTGFLVVEGDSVPAATRPLAVKETADHPSLPLPLVLSALALALVIVLGRWSSMNDKPIPWRGGPPKLGDTLGSVKWKVDESWLSSVTGVGAILGTVLADAVLPEEIPAFPKAQFVGLNVFFLIVITAAGFVFRVLGTSPEDDAEQFEPQGTVLGFLVASALTLWAVMGELAVLVALLWVLRDQDSLTTAQASSLIVLVVALFLLMTFYAWRAMNWAITRRPRKAEDDDTATDATATGATRRAQGVVTVRQVVPDRRTVSPL